MHATPHATPLYTIEVFNHQTKPLLLRPITAPCTLLSLMEVFIWIGLLTAMMRVDSLCTLESLIQQQNTHTGTYTQNLTHTALVPRMSFSSCVAEKLFCSSLSPGML